MHVMTPSHVCNLFSMFSPYLRFVNTLCHDIQLFAKLTTGSVSTTRMEIYVALSRTTLSRLPVIAIESRIQPVEKRQAWRVRVACVVQQFSTDPLSILRAARAHLEGCGKRGSRTKDKAAYHGRGEGTINAACC
jgi:hypothetical protein